MKAYSTQKKPAPPLNNRRLRDMALHYTGRYATTKAKLISYLARKIRERGWKEGESYADLEQLAEEFSDLGYINDAAYADARARSFVRRGYGPKRLEQDLYAAGISDSDAQDARTEAGEGALEAARTFARRKRIGPYANEVAPPEKRQKQLGSFLRAGHSFDLAKRFVNARPDEEIDME